MSFARCAFFWPVSLNPVMFVVVDLGTCLNSVSGCSSTDKSMTSFQGLSGLNYSWSSLSRKNSEFNGFFHVRLPRI